MRAASRLTRTSARIRVESSTKFAVAESSARERASDAFEAAARDIAVRHREKVARRDASEKIYRIRCCGCGAKLVDSDAFQAHCGEVEHGDDFAFECEDIFEATYDEEEDG